MRWTALAALLLLAGCLDGPADPAVSPGDEDGRTGRPGGEGGDVGHYEASFGLTVNPESAVAVSVGGVTQGNCVLFWDANGAGYVLRNGTATLEWDAMTPLAGELGIYVTGSPNGTSASGPSPLTLPIGELEPDGWGLGFAADTPLGSLAVQQAVTLTLSFDHEGDLPAPGIGSCGNGL